MGRTETASRTKTTTRTGSLRGSSDSTGRGEGPDGLRGRAKGAPRRGHGKRARGNEAVVGRKPATPTMAFGELIEKAEGLVQEGELEKALPIALKALKKRQPEGERKPDKTCLPALNLIAEIYLELGAAEEARKYFLIAVEVDPEGTAPFDKALGGGVEKFLYLAQLSEEGGQDSINWLQKGVNVLRREIMKHNDPNVTILDSDAILMELQRSLAGALCAMVEIYMTDLSFENDSEQRCEILISEALPLWEASESSDPTTLQTLANIRISQSRLPEARETLKASLELWDNSLPDDGEENHVPDFPTRISLSRLLMESGMESDAIGILERLVAEDDHSVEAWYLGGWCLYLLGRERETENEDGTPKEGLDSTVGEIGKDVVGAEDRESNRTASLKASRQWLRQSLKLYEMLDYEDDRLHDHAMELSGELDKELGEEGEEEAEEEFEGFGTDDDDEEDEDEDVEMGGG